MAKRPVYDSWARAVEMALTRGYQTGWVHKVRRVPATAVWILDRTDRRVRHRCNAQRERELGRHVPWGS